MKNNSMTEEEINIAIAQVRGWTDFRVIGRTRWFGIPPNETNKGDNYSFLPGYCNDLNVMHSVEVEHIIPNGLWDEYVSAIKKSMRDGERFWGQADARQRAEAFVRTLGLWED